MSALFGFLGDACPNSFNRMSDVLKHRGPGEPASKTNQFATIGYRTRNSKSKFIDGLYSEVDVVIGLSGYLVGSGGEAVTLKELLIRYRSQGIDSVSSLKGSYILVIQDRDCLHLIRDGAGARTVYYGQHNGRFFFAEEPKGIVAVNGFPRRIRPGAVAQYLTFSFVPGVGTMLEDISEVQPGHIVTLSSTGVQSKPYFFFDHLENTRVDTDDYWVDRFRSTFQQAVRERYASDNNAAVYLSGGLDSSIVVAELAKLSNKPVKTYAIHFGKDYEHELDFARAVADRCGTDHEEVLIRPKGFLNRFRKMIWHLDDPIGDPITMPNFELSNRASQDVKTIFNGEGGDPLFGGPKNIPMLLEHWYGGVDRPKFFRERQYLASYRRSYSDLDSLLTPEWRSRYNSEQELEQTLVPFFQAEQPKHFLNKLSKINICLKGGHLILPKVDKMTAAWGLTAHAPLFDERLIQLSFEMPPHLKLQSGIEKIILKKSYESELPKEVIDRPKSGMRVPVHFWFQKEMKRYAHSILSERRIKQAGIFNPQRVKQLLKYDIDEGQGRYGLRLWMLLTFEVWRRIVVEGEAV